MRNDRWGKKPHEIARQLITNNTWVWKPQSQIIRRIQLLKQASIYPSRLLPENRTNNQTKTTCTFSHLPLFPSFLFSSPIPVLYMYSTILIISQINPINPWTQTFPLKNEHVRHIILPPIFFPNLTNSRIQPFPFLMSKWRLNPPIQCRNQINWGYIWRDKKKRGPELKVFGSEGFSFVLDYRQDSPSRLVFLCRV